MATFVYPSYTFVNAYFEIHFHKINSYLISDSYRECPFIPKEKEVEKNRKKPFIPPLCLFDLKGKGGFEKEEGWNKGAYGYKLGSLSNSL